MNLGLSVVATFVLVSAAFVVCDAAPLSTADEVALSEVLKKANLLLDRLLAQTSRDQTRSESSDIEDFEVQLDERYNPENSEAALFDVMKRNYYWDRSRNRWVWSNSIRPSRNVEIDAADELEQEASDEKLHQLVDRVTKGWKWDGRKQDWVWGEQPRPERNLESEDDVDDDDIKKEATDEELLEIMKRNWVWDSKRRRWVWVPARPPPNVRPERSAGEPDTDMEEANDEELLEIMKRYWKWDYHRKEWVWVPPSTGSARPERSYGDTDEEPLQQELSETEQGHVPYAQKDDVQGDDQVDEVSLKDAIRWLQELREKRVKDKEHLHE